MRISEVSSDHSAGSSDKLSVNNDALQTPYSSVVQKLESLVTEIEQMAPKINSDTVQKLRSLVGSSIPTRLNESQKSRIWKLSSRIWNTCIHVKNSLQLHGEEVGQEHAELRHIASDLRLAAGNVHADVHSSLLETALFYFKTATIWHKLHNYEMASTCFEKATELSNRAKDHRPHPHHHASATSAVEKEDKFLFDLHIARARTASELQQKAFMQSLLGRARGMLRITTSPSSTEMYEKLADEFLYYGKMLLARSDKSSVAESINFFEKSYEVCSDGISALLDHAKKNNSLDGGSTDKREETIALNALKLKILRFLAAGHLQNDNFENVLKCIEVLKSGPDHALTAFLALKAYIGLNRFEDAIKEIYIVVSQKSSSADICAAAIEALIESWPSSSIDQGGKASKLLQDTVKKVFTLSRSRFPSNKELTLRVLDKLLTSQNLADQRLIETALSIALDEDVVRSIIQDSANEKSILQNSNSENVDQINSGSAQQCIYCLLWNSGQEAFQAKEYSISIQLFEACLMYLISKDAQYAERRAKNLRVLCICHLALAQYDRASDYINEANKTDPSIIGVFLKFKISLQINDADCATKQLEDMFKCPDFDPSYLTLASHEAISCKCVGVAICALSRLLEMSKTVTRNNNTGRKEVVIIRNIIALSTQEPKNLSAAVKHFKLAQSHLTVSGVEEFFGPGSIGEKEAQWYAGCAWNEGLDATKSDNWEFATDLFFCAADFYEVLPETLEILQLRKAAIILALGCVFLTHNSDDKKSNNSRVKESVAYFDKCRKIQQLIKLRVPVTAESNDSTDVYLNLISFEMKKRMNDIRGQLDIIYHCRTLPEFKPLHFFAMGKDTNMEVAVAAFEAGLEKILASSNPDYADVAYAIRQLITLADTEKRDGPKTLELYKQAYQILLGIPTGVYPKEEVHWLVSTAWNRAALHVRFSRFSEAEAWMNLALDMLKHAPGMEVYRSVMLDNLGAVLKGKGEALLPMV